LNLNDNNDNYKRRAPFCHITNQHHVKPFTNRTISGKVLNVKFDH